MTTTGHRQAPTPRKRWRINWQAIVGILLVAAAAYTAGETYHAGEVSQQRSECQSQVNDQFLRALKAYDVAQERTNDAQRKLLTANTGGDRAASQRARDDYLDALAGLDKARTATPLPEVTRC